MSKLPQKQHHATKLVLSLLGIVCLVGLVIFICSSRPNPDLHEFSLQAFVNDKSVTKVSIGDIIKVALYYVPGKDTESGLQTSVHYSAGVTPVYDGQRIRVDTSNAIANYVATDNLKSGIEEQESSWLITAHDLSSERTINFVGLDISHLSALDQPGVLASIYFTVDQDAPSEIRFSFVPDKTVISNNRPYQTKDLTLKVER